MSMKRRGKWRPIASAPKVHGTRILSTNRHGVVDIICWNSGAVFHEDLSKPPNQRFSWSGAWDDGERGNDVDDGAFQPFEPKVWMPLPELPPEGER